jgi:ATP-dependent DNA helicase DinG
VPGNDLSMVVVMRLPFSVPDDPLQRRFSDQIREKGGNPFYDLSLPEAILKLRQGFGRLIRTMKDRGIFVVMDKRIISKSYGRIIRSSLPGMKMTDSLETVRRFYNAKF